MVLDSSDEDVDEYQLDEVNDPGSGLMQALMEAEALGLVNEDVADQDEQQEVVPELPITPFREPRLQLPLATSTLKRDARSSSSTALSEEVRSAPSQRRRLYTQQPGEEPVKKSAAAFEFSDDIDGIRIDAHQLFKTYTRLKPETRRLISKKCHRINTECWNSSNIKSRLPSTANSWSSRVTQTGRLFVG